MATSVDSESAREEMLSLLGSMGIKLPAFTKLPFSELDSRVARTLDYAQRHAELTGGKGTFKTKKLSAWKKSDSLSKAMRSMSLEEMVGAGLSMTAFGEVRLMLCTGIADLYELQGVTEFFFEDPEMDRSIRLTIDNVYMVTDGVPLITVQFTQGKVADDDEEGFKVINTPAAHTLFSKLLQLNAAREQQSQKGRIKKQTSFSYLLPLGPLGMKEIGSLTKDVGCLVCGGKVTSTCSGCHAASYCGKDCQRADWKHHKAVCRSLDTGTWLKVTYSAGFTAVINRSARSFNTPTRASGSEKNVHGANAFLVKVQIAGYNGPSMMIYDRQHSFDGHFLRTEDPDGFQRLADVVHTGYMGLKVYLWAKYIGPRQLSICLDRKPDQAGISW